MALSAFACEPDQGSEEGIGWNWAVHLGRRCRVSVLTQGKHRQAIERWLAGHPLSGVRFYYVDAPGAVQALRGSRLGLYLHYSAWQYIAYRRALVLLREDPFDLAHHVSYCSIPGQVFMHRLPVPFVFGPVGGGETMPLQFWGGGGVRPWLFELVRSARIASLRWDPLVRATLRRAARIVVPTEESRRFIPTQLHHKLLSMNTSGVESSQLGDPTAGGGGAQVWTAGRLVHWKGFHLAIRAFARVARRRPDAMLRVVGDGPQRARLERLAAAEGVGDRVKFEGQLPRAQVLHLAEQSDVFLFPSLHDSGPTVVLEAMAAGKPVVGVDAGGTAMIVAPECGIKVPVSSPERVVADLAEALERLIADGELRRQMGAAGRDRTFREYVWDKRADRMLGIYRQVVVSEGG